MMGTPTIGAFGRSGVPRFDLVAMQANERAQGTHHCGRCEPCKAWERILRRHWYANQRAIANGPEMD